MVLLELTAGLHTNMGSSFWVVSRPGAGDAVAALGATDPA